jgi:hypothetical protein
MEESQKPEALWVGNAMLVAVGLAVGLAFSCSKAPNERGQQIPVGTSVQGTWRNAGTTMQITQEGAKAIGTFQEVSQGAFQLGFKPGERSFEATIVENYLYGVQTIRYGGTCHTNGRNVPMIGRLTSDGQALAIHFYNITVDNTCRDTGQYEVTESLWQRVPGQ